LYPNQYVYLEDLQSHMDGKLCVDEVAIIRPLKSSPEVLQALKAAT